MKNLFKWVISLSAYLVLATAFPLFSQSHYEQQQQHQQQQQQQQNQKFSPPAVQNPPSMPQQISNQQLPRIAVLNTRRCLEESKMSSHERATLEKMKSQMESVLKDKEKAIHTIENKLRDEDYMDSISEEAERELRHKKKILIEEGVELNRQFSDNLEMTNMKIMQTIIEAITKASKEVVQESASKNQIIDLILTSEACTYFNPVMDITDPVLTKMNATFEVEQKEQAAKKQ